MRKGYFAFLLIVALLFAACSAGGETGGASEADREETGVSTREETPAPQDTEPSDAGVLDYLNEVAYFAYGTIDRSLNNSFDDREFFCEVNLADGTWEIPDAPDLSTLEQMTKLMENLVKECQAREYSQGGAAVGVLLVKYVYGELHHVQYRDTSLSPTLIGQFPDAASTADGHIEWGVFHNKMRCEICGSN